MSPNRRGGGHIAFGANPVGVGVLVRVASCQILTKTSLSAPYILNQIMDSGQTLCIVSLG